MSPITRGHQPEREFGGMMNRLRCPLAVLPVLASLAALLVGCDWYAPAQPQTPPVPTDTVTLPPFLSAAISTVTALDRVPTYDEIESTVYRVTHTPEHPEGPEAGFDGIVDLRIIQQLDAYNDELSGKKVKDWHGCAVNLYASPTSQERRNIGLYMERYKGKPEDFTPVELLDLTYEQVQSLGLTPGACVMVKFSGTFADVDSSGRIWITDVTVAPAD